jgi:glycosyltransferase involved in cell wall biosynthesis
MPTEPNKFNQLPAREVAAECDVSPLKPLASVIVPLYNKASYVDRCIASLLAQTDSDFEVIVVDDGSTDDGFAQVRARVAKDPRFRVLQQANGGVSRARNAGVAKAKADWLLFLDADDEWRPTMVAAMRGAIAAYPNAVMISGDTLLSAHGVMTERPYQIDRSQRFLAGYDFFGIWGRGGACPAFISATAIRKDMLRKHGGFPEGMNLGEDLLVFTALARAGSCVFINEVVAIYHEDTSASLSRTPSASAVKSHERLLNELERLYDLGVCPAAVRDKHRDIHVHHLMMTRNRDELWRYLWRRPGYWSLRVWSLALLEMAGMRAPLRAMFKRGA